MKNTRYWALVPREQIAGLPTASAIDTKVWLVIRSFAFDRGVARDVGFSEIAKLAGIDRKNVPRSIRRLEAAGSFSVVRGGPRKHIKNIYLLPNDAGDDQTAISEGSVLNSEDTPGEKSVLSGEDTSVLNTEDRSVLSAEDPLETLERREILERGVAREARPRPAKKGVSSIKPVAGRQQTLLLPIDGAGKRNGALQPACDITAYQPPAGIIEWAREKFGVEATDEQLLGSFRHYQPRDGRPWPPPDLDKAFRNWIRKAANFAASDQHARPTHRPRRAKRGSIYDAGNAKIRRWDR